MVETIAFRGRSEAVDETEFKMAMRQVAPSEHVRAAAPRPEVSEATKELRANTGTVGYF